MSEIKEIGKNDKIVLNKVIEKAQEVFDEIYFYDKEGKYDLKNVKVLDDLKNVENILKNYKGVILVKGSNSTGLYDFMKERS
jgi:UDP-N-acetylmuramoyl-tripeptide--D-alanyl-D-alanine ligase